MRSDLQRLTDFVSAIGANHAKIKGENWKYFQFPDFKRFGSFYLLLCRRKICDNEINVLVNLIFDFNLKSYQLKAGAVNKEFLLSFMSSDHYPRHVCAI